MIFGFKNVKHPLAHPRVFEASLDSPNDPVANRFRLVVPVPPSTLKDLEISSSGRDVLPCPPTTATRR